MSNLALGYPIWTVANTIYAPSRSGGTWSATLPLTNLADRRMALVARSSAATLASTQFDTDLKTARRVGLISIPKHTISTAGKVRFRGFSTVPIFDSLTVGDAAWTATGTPTRTAAAFTSADNMPLDLVGDDAAGAIEYYSKTVTFTGNGTKAIRFRVARSSAYASHAVDVYDVTAATWRLSARCDFTTTTLAVTCPTYGTFVSATARGDGSWDVLCLATGVLAANTNQINVAPAVAAAGDTAAFYIGAVTAWDAATDQQVYEAGLVDPWRAVYNAGSLAAGDPRLSTGKYSAEEAIGFIPGLFHCPTTVVEARYWRTEVHDTTNAAGYVDLALVDFCDRYAPTINMDYGWRLGLKTATTRTETDGGAAVFNVKAVQREIIFTVNNLSDDETLSNIYEIQRRLGISGDLYVVVDPADTYHIARRSFPCTIRELSSIEHPWYTRTSVPFALLEKL